MRSNSLFPSHTPRCKQFALASLALWCLGVTIPVIAQDSALSTAALPSDPSPSTTTLPSDPSANASALPSDPAMVQHYVSPTKSEDHSLTLGKRARIYSHDMFSLETIVGPAFGAGIGQWEDEPSGWHQGAEGYGKRFGSGIARHTIDETIRFGFAAVDGEDPRYFLSEDRSFWGRTRHAIVSTFVSQRASGGHIPAFSRFAGTYGASFISNVWYPDNRATAGYAARRGSTALASSIGFHLLREFVPMFRHAPE